MRYIFFALMVGAGLTLQFLPSQGSHVAAGDGCASSGSDGDPTCFLRRRLAFSPATSFEVLGEPRPKELTLDWPSYTNYPDRPAKPTFTGCGENDNEASYPIATVLDPKDENFFWLGEMKKYYPRWECYFKDVPFSNPNMDPEWKIIRVEDAYLGASKQDDFKLDKGGYEVCPAKQKKSKVVGLAGVAGEKLTITSPTPTVVIAGTPVTLSGKTKSEKMGVYGVLIPINSDGTPGKAVGVMKRVGAPPAEAHWAVRFDTAGLSGNYILRVRRGGKEMDKDAFDHRTILVVPPRKK